MSTYSHSLLVEGIPDLECGVPRPRDEKLPFWVVGQTADRAWLSDVGGLLAAASIPDEDTAIPATGGQVDTLGVRDAPADQSPVTLQNVDPTW